MNKFLSPKHIHTEAMNCYSKAIILAKCPEFIHDKSLGLEHLSEVFIKFPENVIFHLFLNAYVIEKKALIILRQHPEANTTRAMICRSAGWMALAVGEIAEAALLADEGLEIVSDGYVRQTLIDLKTQTQSLLAE